MNRVPLAARMRPRSLDEFYGQAHLVRPGAAFRIAAEVGSLGSVILWGPPGVGKTTLAEIIATLSGKRFERVSAVSAGVADLRRIVEAAKSRLGGGGLFDAEESASTLLFIDEIHRFNKAQQDAILPFVEDGTVTLIGATTENPSFEVNAALMSRCRVYVLEPLADEDLMRVLKRAVDSPGGLGGTVNLSADAMAALVGLANGDARALLTSLELCAEVSPSIDVETVKSAIQRRSSVYDKGGEAHFDLISALHKSVRGSDPDASLYWLARMIEHGEDPLYLARRIVRMATEDIGLADPQALILCMAAQQAVHFLGVQEGALALAEAVVFLALSPKSNAVYAAYGAAVEDVASSRNDPVPLHLRNAPTQLMSDLGFGDGYRYAHEFEGGVVEQQNLPDALAGRRYYAPTDRGYELRLKDRMQAIRAILEARAEPGS